MSDSRLQEIMIRAVVGRAERTLTWRHKLAASGIKQVLGVKVGKTALSVAMEENRPIAELTVDCDLWCSGEAGTKVLRTRCRCLQEVPVSLQGEVTGEAESELELVSGPRSTGIRVEGESIYIDFEATVHVEVTAQTRLWVRAYDRDLFSGDTARAACAAAMSGDVSSPFGSH
ncbi:MAG: hypothetical protein ACOY94_24645 [Bacillota bacterium]